MNLSEKIKHLREVEGELRGLNRPMTQMEVVNAMMEEGNGSISQAYLSQLEGGKRVHLTQATRDLLANFFKVHPGYLVSDPPDYSTDLLTDMDGEGDHFITWLIANASEWRSEQVIQDFFQRLARTEEPRQYLQMFEQLMDFPVTKLEEMIRAITPRDQLPTHY